MDETTLLPILPFVESYKNIVPTQKYDHLFKFEGEGEAYFRMGKPNSQKVQIKSKDMRYWQVYTPADGNRIAVEPMTFFGNIYSVYS